MNPQSPHATSPKTTLQPTTVTPVLPSPSAARAVRIGVDGGGTKTDFILIDGASGQLLAQRRAPGCSPSHLDKATIYRLITENIDALLAEATATPAPSGGSQALTITHCCLCTAGAPPFWKSLAAELAQGATPLGQIHSFDDSLPVLELATGGGPGLVLHAGTGSFVAARGPDLRAHYAGGLGWRVGDQGSAHDLGRRAAEHALLELQGWPALAPPTPHRAALPPRSSPLSPLAKAVCDQLGIHSADALLQHIYNTPESGAVSTAIALPALAPLVTTLAAEGDPVATEILHDSVHEFARLARAVSARLFGEAENADGTAATAAAGATAQKRGADGQRSLASAPPIRVGLSGPILRSETATRAVAQALGPRHMLHAITEPPLEGLRQLLARL